MGDVTTAEYRIPECNVNELIEKLIKINKKALKLGCNEIQIIPGKIEEKVIESGKNAGKILRWVNITITGESPVLDGWKFIATVQHLRDVSENIIRKISKDIDIPVQYRSRIICDHCHVNRYRKETFLVSYKDTGLIMQIGRSCLKDFLGHKDPHAVANMCEWMSGIYELASSFEDQDEDAILNRDYSTGSHTV